MTLYEFRCLFLDDSQEVKIYNINGDDIPVIFEGEFCDLPEEYEDIEISSIDNVYGDCNFIGINVELEEEEEE
jgi:hypothetical protein